MGDANNVFLVGRLVKPPEYHPAGHRGEEHCTFTLAINRVVPSEQGPEADYVPCSMWGSEVVGFCERCGKGDEIHVRGRIRTSLIPQADGGRKHFWEIRADHVQEGRRSLRNLQSRPRQDRATEALGRLTKEFGG